MDAIVARTLGLKQPPELSPAVATAIQTAKEKIAKKVRIRCMGLQADLGLVLDHFLDANGLEKISWSGAVDRVEPGFGLDLLVTKIGDELIEIQFREFLNQFFRWHRRIGRAFPIAL
jgi:hypothetical protein